MSAARRADHDRPDTIKDEMPVCRLGEQAGGGGHAAWISPWEPPLGVGHQSIADVLVQVEGAMGDIDLMDGVLKPELDPLAW